MFTGHMRVYTKFMIIIITVTAHSAVWSPCWLYMFNGNWVIWWSKKKKPEIEISKDDGNDDGNDDNNDSNDDDSFNVSIPTIV